MNYEIITQKKKVLDKLRPFPVELVRNLDDWFNVELTYTSNAIEGNTLTRHETAVILEKGLTVGGKSLKEHLEATNHSKALDFVYSLLKRQPHSLSEQDILTIHDIILKGIDDDNSGHYRSVPVRLSGSTIVLPNPRKVPDLMEKFQEWLTSNHDFHPVAFAGEAHYRLVTIHPFVDGNGRTARLLMNLILLMYGYPPAIIRKRDRLSYITSLEKAQLGGSKEPYEKIIIKAVDRSLDIYLKAAQGQSADNEIDRGFLLKIGELAKEAGETVATIRYWTKEGLLEVAELTESGYQLYDITMKERCKNIQELKTQRLTISEIRDRFREGDYT
jgi:Fic family protein